MVQNIDRVFLHGIGQLTDKLHGIDACEVFDFTKLNRNDIDLLDFRGRQLAILIGVAVQECLGSLPKLSPLSTKFHNFCHK